EQDARLAKAAGSPMQSLDAADDPVSEAIRLRQAFEQLEVQRGIVTIGAAHATLSIPTHFRLVPRRSIEALSTRLGGGPVERDLFGWLVHDSVDLADDDAWFIAVSYSPIGHVSASDAEDLSSPDLVEANRKLTAQYAGGEYAFDAFEHVPAWREDIGTLAWGETLAYTDNSEKLIDCYAVKPTRAGVIAFMAEYMPKARSELCLRSVRLMAASTRFDAGWGWDDYSFFRDSRAGADFADVVTGAAFE
ncbi:MAG TPA: DUF2167 domain-containing protein, partial [Candidatus Saccharimonadia bacterium]|nr:DUF2167 domain-containing protein [Candidatus Saccharimonadia bacterium]